jgi:hypothetical protein
LAGRVEGNLSQQDGLDETGGQLFAGAASPHGLEEADASVDEQEAGLEPPQRVMRVGTHTMGETADAECKSCRIARIDRTTARQD